MDDLTLVVGAAVVMQALQTVQAALNNRGVRRDLRQLEHSLRPPPRPADERVLRTLEQLLERDDRSKR